MSIELPKDAEGREIPLDTVCMYDCNGESVSITRWCFTTRLEPTFSEKNIWIAVDTKRITKDPVLLHLTPPDSWKKLLEDLDRAIEARNESDSPVCSYTNHLDDLCDGCKFHGGGFNCKDKMLVDIASRIRKLRGED